MVEDIFYREKAEEYKKQLENQAKEAQDRVNFFETMARNIPGGYHRCSINDGFRLEFVSESFLRIVGYTREKLKTIHDNKFINLVAPEDYNKFMAMEPALIRDGAVEAVYRIVRKDGTYRWVQDSTLHVNRDGEEYYQCMLSDITDFVNQQQKIMAENIELMREKTFKETIENNMPGGYHRCAAKEGCPFIFIGTHFTDIVGYTTEEIEKDFDNMYINLLWDEDRKVILTYENMINMRGKGNMYDNSVYRLKHKDGGYRWVSDATMFVDIGEESFFQSILTDITGYIESLNEEKKKAEASNMAKSTFLFNASHDIRTPMNAIQGFAHIIYAHL